MEGILHRLVSTICTCPTKQPSTEGHMTTGRASRAGAQSCEQANWGEEAAIHRRLHETCCTRTRDGGAA
eukprot:4799107-Prymnesium_polylepis.2